MTKPKTYLVSWSMDNPTIYVGECLEIPGVTFEAPTREAAHTGIVVKVENTGPKTKLMLI